VLCTAGLYRVISLYPLLGQTWRLASYIIMRERERETCGAGEWDRKRLEGGSTPHPSTDAWPLAVVCVCVMHEPQREQKTMTEREHEGCMEESVRCCG